MEMKKGYRADACLVLCGVLLWFLADAARLRLEALKALTLCAGTVIPSLFPFMTVTALLVRLGFGQWLAPHTAGLMAPLFRLPGCASSALLLGLVGGYPIGARTAAELYASGALTRAEAERLLTFCNNSNPVFLISVLGVGVFGSVRAGLWLWLLHIAAALLTGLLLRGHGTDRRSVPPAISFQAPSLSGAFVSAVRDSASGMLSVCAFVTLFYVLAAGCAGWGGLSVLCQTAAILDGTDLPLRPCVLGKLMQGLLSAALAALLFGFFRALGNVYTGFAFLKALNVPSTVYNMLPYIISLIVLAFTSKSSHAPKAEGIPYDKGQR